MNKKPNSSPTKEVTSISDILGKEFPVLDDGFIRLVDYMGDDSSIVQAARISYGSGTKQVHHDRGLIRYLMRHHHTTPFEMCEIKLHVRVPMDTWRQWIRHRTANVNEYSTRYSIAIDASQKTPADMWRLQDSSNRQGGDNLIEQEKGSRLSKSERELHDHARAVYLERLALGVAREQARKDLPLSTYTEAYWKIDLHNLFHFLALRGDVRAQAEIRAYANVIGTEIVKNWCPLAWEAFVDYVVCSMSLARHEQLIISHLVQGNQGSAREAAVSAGILRYGPDKAILPNRERTELEEKLLSLGHDIPW